MKKPLQVLADPDIVGSSEYRAIHELIADNADGVDDAIAIVKETIRHANSTLERLEKNLFDPCDLGTGEVFQFVYPGGPRLLLMRLSSGEDDDHSGKDGAVVLRRAPADGCGCSDRVGNVWPESSLGIPGYGTFEPLEPEVVTVAIDVDNG